MKCFLMTFVGMFTMMVGAANLPPVVSDGYSYILVAIGSFILFVIAAIADKRIKNGKK